MLAVPRQRLTFLLSSMQARTQLWVLVVEERFSPDALIVTSGVFPKARPVPGLANSSASRSALAAE
jgi:hypothetical protein